MKKMRILSIEQIVAFIEDKKKFKKEYDAYMDSVLPITFTKVGHIVFTICMLLVVIPLIVCDAKFCGFLYDRTEETCIEREDTEISTYVIGQIPKASINYKDLSITRNYVVKSELRDENKNVIAKTENLLYPRTTSGTQTVNFTIDTNTYSNQKMTATVVIIDDRPLVQFGFVILTILAGVLVAFGIICIAGVFIGEIATIIFLFQTDPKPSHKQRSESDNKFAKANHYDNHDNKTPAPMKIQSARSEILNKRLNNKNIGKARSRL